MPYAEQGANVRVGLDTNVLVSGLLWKNIPYQLVQAAIQGEIEIYSSTVLVSELEEVLARPHLAHKLAEHNASVIDLVLHYKTYARIIVPAEINRTVLIDPDDDAVLACALAAGADLVVSGDLDLLNLKSFQRIPIVTPIEALARIRAG